MQQFPRSAAQQVRNIDSPYERPKVILLDERHWSYIQRRYHISPRELEVAKLVCHGLNNREIADALHKAGDRQNSHQEHLSENPRQE